MASDHALAAQQVWQHFPAYANIDSSHRFLLSVDQRFDTVNLPIRSGGGLPTRFTAVYGLNRLGPARAGEVVMMEIVAQEGETLDALLWRILRRTDIAPLVLAANAHLASLPPILPAGTKVAIPALPDPPVQSYVRLWG